MTTDELKSYYSQLLIIQYRNAPNAAAMVEGMVNEIIADQIFSTVRDAFDLDTAVGVQLDVLGTYLGVDRFVYGLSLTKSFFAMPLSTDGNLTTAKGFGVGTDTNDTLTWYFLTADDTSAVVYRMNDQEYRQILKFAAATQSSNLSIKDIDDILFNLFGTAVTLIDNKNMTITYNDSASDPLANIFTLINESDLLPKPAAVAVSVTHV